MSDLVLSHYRILDRLGMGGMGVVYLAHDERLERNVAIKVLRPDMLATDSSRGRFRTEALALSRLSHPGIAIVHEFDRENDTDYLVMEFVPGETLAAKLTRGPLGEAETAEIGAQIADALAAAHEQGVVHRDLKPGNVIITPEGRAKVLDFGLAKLGPGEDDATRSATAPLAMAGTLAYMAPEQVTGTHIGPRTDLYALGAILYEAATGVRPHDEPSIGTLVYAIAHQPPPPPRRLRPELSAAFESIVLQALEKDPALRPASATEMAAVLRGTAPGTTRPSPTRATSPRIESLAVLPLVNLSGDPSQEYFADGMTEALIASLAGIGALRVISRTTAMRYKGASQPIAEIARTLGVQGIFEGSVLRVGERVRISVQLIDAAADRLLWTRTHEGPVGNVLELQAQVARSVASEVRVQLTPRELARLSGPRIVDPRAYEAYLRGRFHWNRRTAPEMLKGIAFFQQAIEIDPGDPLPHVGLADSYNLLGDMNELLPHEAASKAKAAVRRALEIDPELGEAHTSLGFLHMFYDWDWRNARREFEHALELHPGYPTGHQWYSELLTASGEFERAIAEAHRAHELDPLAAILGTTLGDAYFYARRYDEAEHWLRRTHELEPGFVHVMNDLGRVMSESGRYDEALMAFDAAHAMSGGNPIASVGRAYTLARAGRHDEARATLTYLEAESTRRYVSPHAIAAVLIGLGEYATAIDWLERAYREHDRALVWMNVHPRLDPLRGDPRFDAIVRRVMTGS